MRHIAILLPVLLGGCFSYAALGGATPPRGSDVVARLSVPLQVPLQDVTVRQVTVTTGKVTYADGDSLVIVAERFTSDAGIDYPGLGSQVTIQRSHIAELEQRRVSGARTGLLFGAGAAALVAIVTSVGPLLGSGSSGSTGPPQQP